MDWKNEKVKGSRSSGVDLLTLFLCTEHCTTKKSWDENDLLPKLRLPFTFSFIHSMKLPRSLFTLPLAILLPLSSASGIEPLLDATEEYVSAQIDHKMSRFDTNKDGKIQKTEEDERSWKRNARYDTNKDGALDAEELRKIPFPSIDGPGKKLLNVCYKVVDDKKLYLDFYFPDEDTSTDKPVVVFTHGGGWAAGNKAKAGAASFNTIHRALLKEGFCVLSVGYRLVDKGGESAMRDCVIDCQDAIRFASAHQKALGIDPKKIYTFGDSAGGHLAQMLLLAPTDSFLGDAELAKHSFEARAGVSWYGPCDFQDVQLFNHDDRDGFRDRFGPRIMAKDSKPEDKDARYREMSPVSYLKESSPPLLMIQGDKDTTIPVKQAYRMQEALKTIKAPVEILIVKNAGHNWRSVGAEIAPSRKEIIDATIAFFLKQSAVE